MLSSGSELATRNARSLRVLFVVGQFPALSETFVLDQITGLLDRGFDVHVLGIRPPPAAPRHAAVELYGLAQRTLYYATPLGGRLRDVARLMTWLRAEPLRVVQTLGRAAVHEHVGAHLLGRALALRGAEPFDAVIAHFGPNGLKTLALRDLGLLGAPMATFFHGHDVSRWLEEHGLRSYAPLFSRSELMLPISEHWRRRLLDLGCPHQKIRVHRMGVDLVQFPYLAPSLPTERTSPFNVLSVGRLVEKKGFEYALRGLAAALPSHPTLHYHLVGDGPLRAFLQELSEQLGLRDHVRFYGQLTREEVSGVRAGAHITLVPSVTASDGDQEGIPVVLMEAMGSGIPVIATRHSSIPELVVDRETGLLVPERDSGAIAAALTLLVQQPGLAQELSAKARDRVARQHDLARLNDELARTVGELANGAASPAAASEDRA